MNPSHSEPVRPDFCSKLYSSDIHFYEHHVNAPIVEQVIFVNFLEHRTIIETIRSWSLSVALQRVNWCLTLLGQQNLIASTEFSD